MIIPGRYAITGSIDGSARIWDLSAHVETYFNTHDISELVVSPNGLFAFVFRGEKVGELWSIEGNGTLSMLDQFTFEESISNCESCHIEFSPDGNWLIYQIRKEPYSTVVHLPSASMGEARHFEIPQNTRFSGYDRRFSRDSKFLIVHQNEKKQSLLYDLSKSVPQHDPIGIEMDGFSPYNIQFSGDGKWMATAATFDNKIGVAARLWRLPSHSSSVSHLDIMGHSGRAETLKFSPDSKWLVSTGQSKFPNYENDDTSVLIHQLSDSNEFIDRSYNLTGHEYAVGKVVFSPNSKWLLTASWESLLQNKETKSRIWNLDALDSNVKPHILPGINTYLNTAVFSNDSDRLVTYTSKENTAKYWALDSDGTPSLVSELLGPIPTTIFKWDIKFNDFDTLLVIKNTDDSTPYFWRLKKDSVESSGIPIPTPNMAIRKYWFEGESSLKVLSGGRTFGIKNILQRSISSFNLAEGQLGKPKMEFKQIELQHTSLNELISRAFRISYGGVNQNKRSVEKNLNTSIKTKVGRNLNWNEWVKVNGSRDYEPIFEDLPIPEDVYTELLKLSKNRFEKGELDEAKNILSTLKEWAFDRK